MRALAVIPVVLFHADIPGFQGGFVGVDVFFVISGFLISSIVFNELDSGTFCFAQFWERRARRILPALLTVTLVTLLLGWFVLLPDDYAFLGQSALAQSFFATNFLFWRESGGYFGRNASEIPLLHTWSLAVEEQFYLLFPLAAFAVTTYAIRLRAAVVAATVAVSFATSVWAVSNTDAGFWLLPSRAWELGVGVLLALGSRRLQRFAKGIAAEASCVLGIALIGVAVASYDKSTVFPGIAALLPVGGTALVIWANSARLTSTGRILAAKPVVLLGSISYSLYLWHWPVLVLAKYSLVQQLSLVSIASVGLSSVVLAYLSFRFVEAPFRHRKGFRARRVTFAGAAAAIALTGGTGFAVAATQGMPDRYPQVSRSPFGACRFTTRSRIETVRDLCLFGPPGAEPQYLVWGDSHAEHLTHALSEMSKDAAVAGAMFAWGNCPPILGVKSGCSSINERVFNALLASDIRTVVLAGSWSGYDATWAQEGLGATARDLTDRGFDVWIVRDNPRFSFNPRRSVANRMRWGGDIESLGMPLSEYKRMARPFDELFEEMRQQGIKIIDLPGVLCDAAFCPVQRGGIGLYYDGNHLSEQGAEYARPAFRGLMDQLRKSGRGSESHPPS